MGWGFCYKVGGFLLRILCVHFSASVLHLCAFLCIHKNAGMCIQKRLHYIHVHSHAFDIECKNANRMHSTLLGHVTRRSISMHFLCIRLHFVSSPWMRTKCTLKAHVKIPCAAQVGRLAFECSISRPPFRMQLGLHFP